MSDPEKLIVPYQAKWDRVLDELSYSCGCSGYRDDCEHCQKALYIGRSTYLQSYLGVFLQHIDEIRAGTSVMPRLQWETSNRAVYTSLEEWHQKKCPLPNPYGTCDCDTALLLRQMYGNNVQTAPTLDLIINSYWKMKTRALRAKS